MILFSDPQCLSYRSDGHPERPQRVQQTVSWLKERRPDWRWGQFEPATEKELLRAHSAAHLARLQDPRHFDPDTSYYEGIYDLARLAAGATLAAMDAALSGQRAFSLMRPPGHHAERERAMGFCYLNHVAIAALAALDKGIDRVAIWDFDAHHGNGSEAILKNVPGIRYVSVHQHPCYPGTGVVSEANCINFPVPPRTPSELHMEILERSWRSIMDHEPKLVLVSAGFDAYKLDPLTEMTLGADDFEKLGTWVAEAGAPAAALLEGGYSDDLPLLVEAFLKGWDAS